MTVAEAKQYMEEGQFGEDDMLPKIQAAIDFIGDSAIRSVLITKLNKNGTYEMCIRDRDWLIRAGLFKHISNN